MKTATLLLILACLSTYGVAQEVPLYENITDNVPKIGATTEVYMGDRMLEQRTGDYRECIIPKNEYEKGYLGLMFNIKPNKLICKEDAVSELYTPIYIMESDRFRDAPGASPYSIKLAEENGKYTISVCEKGFRQKQACYSGLTFKDISKNEIEILDRAFIYAKNSFQQTILYSGKNGNQLKFIYSEFKDGFARDAFKIDFQVDLNEGNILAFKGALIEVKEPTNVNIVYEVIRNFQE